MSNTNKMNLKKSLRLLVYAILLAAIGILGKFTQSTKSSDTFSVYSWNIEWFPSGYKEPQPAADELARIKTTAKIIRKQGVPDILFGQEIRDAATCSNLISYLNDKHMKLATCSMFYEYGFDEPALQQLAILTRFEVVDAGYEKWHAHDFVYPPRGYAYAVLRIDDKLVACFNVHLKSNYVKRDGTEEAQKTLNRLKRELATEQILRRIDLFNEEGCKGEPVSAFIVGGDFNTSLEDERFTTEKTIRDFLDRGYKNAFEGLTGEEYATLPASQFYPAVTFDYILYSDLEMTGKPIVYPINDMSDHRALKADLRFPK
jgi:endonuclease/exonuclease/phosphatase family metal-dependent hydrolase